VYSEWRIRFLTEKKRNGKLSTRIRSSNVCFFFRSQLFLKQVYHDVEIFFFSEYAKDDVEIFPICVETKLRTQAEYIFFLDGNTC
jgi:hypothetical protein